MVRTIEPNDQETYNLRLLALAKRHGLGFVKSGSTYQFDDFTAHGLEQALGFAEGFDRAKSQRQD